MSGIIDYEMHIDNEVFVHGYIDEIRNDTIIIRNVGGYFVTSRDEGELTVTITLSEYRELIKTSVENKQRKEHESWLEQYNRANNAEERVKELEAEVSNLYKKLAAGTEIEQTERSE